MLYNLRQTMQVGRLLPKALAMPKQSRHFKTTFARQSKLGWLLTLAMWCQSRRF